MPDDTHYQGRVAIVTGAASGIGKALAGALARRGATVVLADVDEGGAKAAADALEAGPPGRVWAVALDVTDAEAVASLVERVAQDHGHLDFLFNNAGIAVAGPVRELTLAHWNRTIDVNLRGVIHGVVAAYPIMIRQGSGHIVNTASLAGLLPAPMLTAYGMTKHGVVSLSESLRMEAVEHGVRVSVVCPGVIDTPLLDKGNPPDLPPVTHAPNARTLLTKMIGRAYPAASLAEDVLDGVARNRPIIVTPRHARIPWRIYRISPRLMIESGPRVMRRAIRSAGG
ncbi:MAG TPA: SDR family oxidoreductase [Acidimicrobiales bacterium]|nr:SDR family oxidoreductase [Acidimicrobiales bacterium]